MGDISRVLGDAPQKMVDSVFTDKSCSIGHVVGIPCLGLGDHRCGFGIIAVACLELMGGGQAKRVSINQNALARGFGHVVRRILLRAAREFDCMIIRYEGSDAAEVHRVVSNVLDGGTSLQGGFPHSYTIKKR